MSYTQPSILHENGFAFTHPAGRVLIAVEGHLVYSLQRIIPVAVRAGREATLGWLLLFLGHA